MADHFPEVGKMVPPSSGSQRKIKGYTPDNSRNAVVEADRKYVLSSFTTRQMEQTILKLLEQWQKKRQREQKK